MIRRIGFHIKSLPEFRRIGSVKGVNLVELKPDKMQRNGDELYSFDGERFEINKGMAEEISDFCKERDIQCQLHLPYERKNDPLDEKGLCYGIRDHHPLLLDRFRMVAELHDKYSIGEIVVMHPPQLLAKGKHLCSYNDGLEHGREFLYQLDKERKEKGWHYKVGLENMAAPKRDSITLGYSIKQLKHLLGNTETIGLTVDSGHRLLSDEMSVARMFGTAPIVSMHFHTNPGVFHDVGHDDDTHQFAEPQNLEHFSTYIRSIRRYSIPVTCEISDLDSIPNHVIEDYVARIRYVLE